MSSADAYTLRLSAGSQRLSGSEFQVDGPAITQPAT